MTLRLAVALTLGMLSVASHADAQGLYISLGVRETNDAGPVGGDGGTSNGIEWINLDIPYVAAGSGWQLVTFDLQNDPITPFAGASADGILGVDYGTIEHLRLLNDGGATQYSVFIDDLVENNSTSGLATIADFELFSVGDEVVFQEPTFSGSTSGNLVGGAAGVTDTMAFAGNHSYQVDLDFVDNDSSRWVRLTTFNTPNIPNPRIETQIGSNVVSMYVKVEAIPEPAGASLALCGLLGLTALRRRVA